MNDDELAKLNSRRGALRLRTFVRVAVLDSVPPTIPQINRDALHHLQRIGGNLNQLSRAVNSGDAADLHELRRTVSELRATLAGASTK